MTHLVTMSLALAASAGCACDGGSNSSQSILRPASQPVDYDSSAWNAYRRELDRLWSEYRRAGSTADSFERYKSAAQLAKRRYVYGEAEELSVSP